jgi:hypothetical protein
MLERNSSGSDSCASLCPVGGQKSGIVRLESRQKRSRRRFQIPDPAGVVGVSASEAPLQLLGPAGLPSRRAANDSQELLVDEQPPARQPRIPLLADGSAERRFELTARRDGHAAADHMVVEHETGVENAAQKDFAHGERMVELVGVLRLELHAADVQRAHDGAVAKPDGRVVDVPIERQAIPSASFPLRPLGWPGPLHGQTPQGK